MTKPSRTSAGRSARYRARKPAFTISMDMPVLDAFIDGLDEDLTNAVRPAAQAGAQVIYDEVMRNVARIGSVSGNLASAIYQAYSADNSGPLRATYHISWNARRAPHGHLVEFGHIQKFKVYLSEGRWYTNKGAPLAEPKQVAARPFIRPARAAFGRAEEAMIAELMKRLKGIE